MQFHHPHNFRQPVADALGAEMPEVMDALVVAGAVPVFRPGPPRQPAGFRCRRITFERVLRAAAEAEPRVAVRGGHAERVVAARGRAAGVVVDGRTVEADLVIDASGRSGRFASGFRAPAQRSDCGLAYVCRQYQLRPGAEEGPLNAPMAFVAGYPGYLANVSPHDNRTFTVLLARAPGDRELAALRVRSMFELAVRAIPGLVDWTDPARSRPITDVLPGGGLVNRYQGQLDGEGRVALPGLVFLGDAVCVTNPKAARGVVTSLMQARSLFGLLDEHGADHASCSLALDRWCLDNIKPWYDDHAHSDIELSNRWNGQDVDLTRRLPSDLIVAAAETDAELAPQIEPYLAMRALPDSLDGLEPQVRATYAAGWRPPQPPGPSRADLVDLLTGCTSSCRPAA
jgi:flavin-dependent dehydrogenase